MNTSMQRFFWLIALSVSLLTVSETTVAQAADPIVYSHSGSWYNPQTNGQGYQVEIIPATNEVLVYWYSYSHESEGVSERRFFVGQGPISEDGLSATLEFFETEGGLFLRPKTVTNILAGTGEIRFSSHSEGTLVYDFAEYGGAGTVPIVRLTPINPNIPDNPSLSNTHKPDGTTNFIQSGHSGSWWDASLSGQGFSLDVLRHLETVILYWYTYAEDGSGRQNWFVASGPWDGNRADFTIYQTTGGFFDDPTAPQTTEWGIGNLKVTSCNELTFTYRKTGFGDRQEKLTRITPNVFCTNEKAAPTPLVCEEPDSYNFSWLEHFGALWPDPSVAEVRTDIPRRGHTAIRFTPEASESASGGFLLIKDNSAAGSARLAVSSVSGNFQVANECVETFGLSGSVQYSVDSAVPGKCSLQSGTEYFINMEFTAEPTSGLCTTDCRVTCKRVLREWTD